jgi:major membrane immunogen (membrane-anchored lipoprotein)
MRRNYLVIALAAMCAAVILTSCGGSKKVAATNKGGESPFGKVSEAPCTEHDTDEEFAATGIASGSKNRMDVLQTTALTNAQSIVRQKMQHAYKGVIDDYSSYMGNNSGSDAKAKVERAGTQLMEMILNDTKATCGPKFSNIDDKGDVTCFIGIRVNKKKIVEAVTNHLSKDDDLQIRFEEQEFRKRMEESFKKFKEDQQQ